MENECSVSEDSNNFGSNKYLQKEVLETTECRERNILCEHQKSRNENGGCLQKFPLQSERTLMQLFTNDITLIRYGEKMGKKSDRNGELNYGYEKKKRLLKEWSLSESLRGVGAIALGYPDSSNAKAAERKENYIVRI